MVSITEYTYELCERTPVEGIDFIQNIPMDNDRLLADMICECRRRFSKKPDIVYIAHSMPFAKGRDYQELYRVMDAPVFWLSGIPCAITHMAVKLATTLIKANKYQRILVIGADKAYSDHERRFFGTIMGDIAIGMMLEDVDGSHEVIATHLDTVLIATEGENSDASLIQKYRDSLPLFLRDAYKQCLSESGLEAVNYIAPHTPNRNVWDVFSKLTGFNRNSILDENIKQTGHLNSNDSFYHYFTHCENGTILPGQSAMLINPGFGGTRGCTILRRI
jgi:3-oxoacyl-[acyl-carrier-protein] synthase-3